jgi:signal transduction histidine kinase
MPERLYLREMAENFIQNIKYMEQAKGIVFAVEGAEDIPFFSDKLRVFTIMNNLLTNAVKYQRPEEDFKTVTFKFDISPTRAVMEVVDNGEGIPDDKRESIFGMFYRLSTQSIGSGLGLYICREMVDRLNGSIELDTSLGRGSSFKVTIPNLQKTVE